MAKGWADRLTAPLQLQEERAGVKVERPKPKGETAKGKKAKLRNKKPSDFPFSLTFRLTFSSQGCQLSPSEILSRTCTCD
jgi:hypothetical protein